MKYLDDKIGIYRIRHKPTGKCYIGSSVHIKKRWEQHIFHLTKQTHHSPYLQNAWDKHGESDFEFEIVEIVADPEKLLEREQVWIDAENPVYNAAYFARRPDSPTPWSSTHEDRMASYRFGQNLAIRELRYTATEAWHDERHNETLLRDFGRKSNRPERGTWLPDGYPGGRKLCGPLEPII